MTDPHNRPDRDIGTTTVEIEAKIAVTTHARLREKLAELGGHCTGVAIECDSFYDTADKSFAREDRAVRLRRISRQDGVAEQAVLTYKGPKQESAMKQRVELQTRLADADAMAGILESMGYVCYFTYEKQREHWQLDDVLIELDTVPELGSFVEIEGPGEQSIRKAMQALGLADEPIITKSYLAMVLQHREDRNPA